jgi:hypothetical protein
MLSYYKANGSLMFRRNSVFEQNISLTELEEMLPFEREIYLIQIEQKIEKYEQQQQQKKKG